MPLTSRAHTHTHTHNVTPAVREEGTSRTALYLCSVSFRIFVEQRNVVSPEWLHNEHVTGGPPKAFTAPPRTRCRSVRAACAVKPRRSRLSSESIREPFWEPVRDSRFWWPNSRLSSRSS